MCACTRCPVPLPLTAVLLSLYNKNFQFKHYDVGLQHKSAEIFETKPSQMDHLYGGLPFRAYF